MLMGLLCIWLVFSQQQQQTSCYEDKLDHPLASYGFPGNSAAIAGQIEIEMLRIPPILYIIYFIPDTINQTPGRWVINSPDAAIEK